MCLCVCVCLTAGVSPPVDLSEHDYDYSQQHHAQKNQPEHPEHTAPLIWRTKRGMKQRQIMVRENVQTHNNSYFDLTINHLVDTESENGKDFHHIYEERTN